MIRLALLGPSWPLRGGIARTTTALAQTLAARGSLAAFLTPKRQYPRVLYPGAYDLDPAACPRLDQAERCFGVLELWTWPRVLRRLRAARPDVLIVPYWTWAWAPFHIFVLRAGIAPAVFVVHNPADHDASGFARSFAHAVLGRASGFFCHAAAVRDTLARRWPETPAVVHPIPPGEVRHADRARARARFGIADSTLSVLCFGLIRPYKGVDVLLEAMAMLPAELNFRLLLAGEPWGKLRSEIEQRLAHVDLRGRVTTQLAWIPEEEAANWFAAADLVVLPYRSATGSAVVAQALAHGLPVVGSQVGGIAEVIEEGRNGLLVPPGDATRLAAALIRLTEPALRSQLARGARESALQWTWTSYAERLDELVARALAGSNRGAL